ncbi:MAG: hypothetical protein QOD35_2661 [Nocardioidaceae bacterium]|nr:hypothetical protein [Nocardioidaceae bacterium]
MTCNASHTGQRPDGRGAFLDGWAPEYGESGAIWNGAYDLSGVPAAA